MKHYTIDLYVEAIRDRDSGNVFWFSTMSLANNLEHIIRDNGIHSGQKQDLTTTDGGIFEAIAHALNNLDKSATYDFNVITKRNRSNIQKIINSLDSYHASRWKVGSGRVIREVPDVIPLKKIYSFKKNIKSMNFISDPDNSIVQEMDLMANTFRDAFYMENNLDFSTLERSSLAKIKSPSV